MTPQEIETLFRQRDAGFTFARWGRPIVPVVIGVDDGTLAIVKGAIEAVVVLAGHRMAETDPELGANLMFFFFREWEELGNVPGLDRLVPEFGGLIDRLSLADADQYRFFRFDGTGAIRAAFAFVRMGGALNDMPAEDLALLQAAQVILLWGNEAFAVRSPLAQLPAGRRVLHPDIAALVRAAYDPLLPSASRDNAFALRLFARLPPEATADQIL